MASRTNSRRRYLQRKREPVRMFGKFRCPTCSKSWQNTWAWIKKSCKGNEHPAYGQQCNSCRGDYVDPFDWEPLRGCDKCGSTDDCNCKKNKRPHNRDLCQKCHSEDPCPLDLRETSKVDQSKKPRRKSKSRGNNVDMTKCYRVFGWFRCPECTHEWPSAYTWIRRVHRGNKVMKVPAFKQQCSDISCNGPPIYPYRWRPLQRGNGIIKKPHRRDLCEACQPGAPCDEASRTSRLSYDEEEDDHNDDGWNFFCYF